MRRGRRWQRCPLCQLWNICRSQISEKNSPTHPSRHFPTPFLDFYYCFSTNSHKVAHSPMFNVLPATWILRNFVNSRKQSQITRQTNMETTPNSKCFFNITPEGTYSIKEAARYLCVHRCTIYTYISLSEKSLPFIRVPNSIRILFRGRDLIAYKSAGLPKKGRKRNRR